MTLRLLAVVAAVALTAGTAHATASLYLYGYNGTGTAATINAGDSITLWFRLFTQEGDDLRALDYRVAMPDNDWIMESRYYSEYDWDYVPYPDGDDFSRPLEFGDFPVVLDEDVDYYSYYDDEGTLVEVVTPEADFFFSSMAFSNRPSGWSSVERFTLTIPEDTPTGRYFMVADRIHAYSGTSGDPIGFERSGLFSLSVQGSDGEALPEPGTFALFGLGLAALALRRARRRG